MKVFITGGTGSLGRALIKRIKELGWDIIVYSRDEGKQALHFGKDKSIKRIIGDVRDLEKLDTAMRLHKPHYVIHTAALKRIDDMELYPDECVKTNINGSENVAIAALKNNVAKCILISTDKACKPINVYGSSKFIAERIFTNYDYNSYWGDNSTIFASVRYGNVIASRGSFIPLWLDFIENDEAITVTSTECTRFLFTLGDAVDTVLDALYTAEGGEVFIPKIKSYKICDVIEALKALTKKDDIKCNVVGLRPGEKIHEDMLADTELPFTYLTEKNILAVLPQYTKRSHTYSSKYNDLQMDSSLHLSNNIEELSELIRRGIEDAN